MWWKRKRILLSFCIQLLILILCSLDNPVFAAEKTNDEGFIIEADRVVGSGMFATIVKQETSENNGKPMLRIQYQSATIYGMKLTKQIDTPNGAVTISLKANGPVTVKNMTVDTTAISFKGACINAEETIPELGMENVVMAAHYMKSNDSLIERLSLSTLSGKTNPQKPGTIKVLQDLSLLPVREMDKQIEKITTGHLPLLCEDLSKTGAVTDSAGTILDPMEVVTKPLEPVTEALKPVMDPLEPVISPLEPVTKPLEPVLKPLEPVTKPLEPVLKSLEPVAKPLEPVLKPLEPVTKPLEPVLKPLKPVTKPLEPVLNPLEPVTKRLEPVSKSLEPVTKPLEPVLKPLEPVKKPLEPVPKPLEPVLKPVTEPVKQVLKSLELINKPLEPVTKGDSAMLTVCERLKESKGVVDKQLALDLIHEGIEKKLPISKVCQKDTTLTDQLQKMETGLLKSLGLFDLLGRIKLEDPIQQLTKIRDRVVKEKDGAIIIKP
ncbi:hypothetical protein M3226_11320 [Neobacillus cucumis]|uniref:DUF6230 family protein n=1 Tax=Neobacillus cucumis TaxID=1740721 RepID=UPI00203FD6E4|nr:DUF6230 family protein [Neobacillus cucumis]MCM3726275.1 hypothetical protein [Neobacillus cucumis]